MVSFLVRLDLKSTLLLVFQGAVRVLAAQSPPLANRGFRRRCGIAGIQARHGNRGGTLISSAGTARRQSAEPRCRRGRPRATRRTAI